MSWRSILLIGAMVTAFAPNARACTIWIEPPLAGESDEAYRQRVAALEREREAQRPAREAEWRRDRETGALNQATAIFIARRTTPPEPRMRRGRPIPPPMFDPFTVYYRPVAWLRGPRTDARFRVQVVMNSCGGMSSIGDTGIGESGQELVFFARDGRLSEETLIEAIEADKVTDPALVAFVERSRRR